MCERPRQPNDHRKQGSYGALIRMGTACSSAVDSGSGRHCRVKVGPAVYQFPARGAGDASLFSRADSPDWLATRALGSGPSLAATNFTWRQTLGKGGTSVLQKCIHRGDGKVYAVKVINKRDLLHQKLGPSVRREIIVQSFLNGLDGFATQLFNVTDDTRSLMIIMELACGGSLADLLKRRRKPLAEAEARFYIAETAAALGLLHDEQYLHGDIKPRNICLDVAGHIKLVDFGSCRRVLRRDAGRFADVVPDGSEWLTTDYAAPESISRKPYSPAIDWFALGGVMFTCLAGTPPFSPRRTTRREVERRILAGRRQPLPHHLSGNCISLLNGLLRMSPEDRFGFADLRDHAWMAGVDWSRVHARTYRPPFIPELRFRGDARYFPALQTSPELPPSPAGSPECMYASLDNFPLCNEARPSTAMPAVTGGSLGRIELWSSPLRTQPRQHSAVGSPPGKRQEGGGARKPLALTQTESEANVCVAVAGAKQRSSVKSDVCTEVAAESGCRTPLAHGVEASQMMPHKPFNDAAARVRGDRSGSPRRSLLHSTVSMASIQSGTPDRDHV